MKSNALKNLARQEEVAAMREGRILRAQTFTNRKRQASRQACRKNKGKDWA